MAPSNRFSVPHRRKLIAVLISSLLPAAGSSRAAAQELPVPCSAGGCGASGPAAWITSGAATGAVQGARFDITQQTDSATFNWRSFNIGADGVVEFKQPDTASVALNRVYGADTSPSRIFGSLKANGQVYIVNQNGVLFGATARVDTAGLLVSSLDLTPDALQNGLTSPAAIGAPALTQFQSATGVAQDSGDIVVASGAVIGTSEGGRVLMFAPNVKNEGTISTPGGQTLLAAGKVVYLAAPTDQNLRGLLVEVGLDGGEVTNGSSANATSSATPDKLVGQILAERGNVTLAGLAVNQLGRVSASTSVRVGGSIRLQARDGAALSGSAAQGGRGGALTLGEHSVTEVSLVDAPTETTVDVNEQPHSQVLLEGKTVDLLAASTVRAPSGTVTLTAQDSWGNRPGPTGVPSDMISVPDASRVYVAEDALIDVSGASVSLAMERNVIEAELRGSQVADSPAQRDGALRSKRIRVDIRNSGARDDGTLWQGTPLADVSGDIALVARSVQERSLAGGTVNVVTQGDLVVAGGATVDVSGGEIEYRSGYINTSSVLGVDGRVYDIATADPDRSYVGFVNGTTITHERWGVTETFNGLVGGPGRFEAGYVEGKDAGTVRVIAPRAVLDGRIDAATTVGPYQRGAATPIPPKQLYRLTTERPLGGALLIGNRGAADSVASAIAIEERTILPTLSGPGGQPFDPRTSRLGALQANIVVRPSLFADGISRLRGDANDRVALAEGAVLDLAPGASVELTAKSGAEIGGTFRSLGGDFAVAADGVVEVASTARIDVSGHWVNDDWRLGTNGLGPSFIDGGSIALEAGELTIDDAAAFLANGGAQRAVDGQVHFGRGGSIELAADAYTPAQGGPTSTLRGRYEAYSGREGGSLAVRAGSVCISDMVCTDLVGSLLVTPEQFRSGGFGSYQLVAGYHGVPPAGAIGDLRVAAGTVIEPTQSNWDFALDPTLVPTGTALESFTVRRSLPLELRRPTDIALAVSATNSPVDAQPYTAATFARAGALVLESGARIEAEAGADVSFATNTRMQIDGAVRAPGGSIEAALTASLVTQEFIPAQTIVLGDLGVFDASGVPLIHTNADNLRTGGVLTGGSIGLTAARGAIVLQAGSVLDASGARGTIDVRSGGVPGAGAAAIEPRTIASAGGSIELVAAEGVFLSGALRVASGDPTTVAGGSIAVTLDPSRRNDAGPTTFSPRGDRDIRVVASDAPLVVGATIPTDLWGTAYLPASILTASGADSIRLRAENTRITVNGTPDILTGRGAITFVDDVQLAARSRIELDAAVLRSTGGAATVSAHVVMLGNQNTIDQATLDTPVTGVGTLDVSADLLELVGRFTTTDFGSIALTADSELRLRGVAAPGESAPIGWLRTTADVVLTAPQIAPTTLSDFTIASLGATGQLGRIATRLAGGQASALLSAGGRVRLEADNIEHGGVLRAPLGSIELAARQNLTLQPASIASTSAQGLTIPFGETQGGFDWAYELPNAQTLVYGPDSKLLPAQRVVLDAPAIDFQAGATIDVSGGGDLQAYEFVPGVTGTRDVLSPLVRPDQFAILPSMPLEFAPYDPAESALFGAEAGLSLTIPTGIGGLPAGTYALLPARYALLPGAFLVTRESGYTDIAPGQTFSTLDGGVVVAGQERVGSLLQTDNRLRGYTIRPGSSAQVEARYDVTKASEFFSASLGAMRLARDAGSLTLLPRTSLNLDGDLVAAPAAGGRGAALELAAERLRVSPTSASGTSGEVVVAASDLANLGAASIVLGARSAVVGERTSLDVTSRSVSIDAGVEFAAPEILLAARERIDIAAGAELVSTPTARGNYEDLSVVGDAAVVRVAGTTGASLERTGAFTGVATIVLNSGATLRSAGAVLLDATGNVVLDGSLALNDAALWLGAGAIALGDAPLGATGLVLDSAQLAALDVRELALRSSSIIDVYGEVTLRGDDLRIRASGFRAATDTARVVLDATRDIELAGGSTAATLTAPTGTTSFSATAGRDVLLEGGQFSLLGFAASSIDARRELVAAADGTLGSAGTLALGAERLLGRDGVSFAWTSLGALDIGAGGSTAGDAGLGARLEFTAASIVHRGRIEAPSGVVRLHATAADVLATDGALIDVAARPLTFDGVVVAGQGGAVELRSDLGNVVVTADASIDVSGALTSDAPAGFLDLLAMQGGIDVSGARLLGRSGAGDGAELRVDALALGDFSTLNSAAEAGGFRGAREYRQRGAGLIWLRGGETLTAERVAIAADQGALRIDGKVDARALGGGRIELAARDDLVLEGVLDASASDRAAGGRVELASRNGLVRTGASSRIDVASGDVDALGGAIGVRMSRDALAAVLSGTTDNPLLGVLLGHDRLDVLGVQRYAVGEALSAYDTDPSFTPWYSEAAAFIDSEPQLLAALGLGDDSAARVVPEIELRSAGDLTLTSDWDLSTWRFGANFDRVGVLTIASAGDLTFAGSLTDGLGPDGFLAATSESWSYRLAAGADASAADALAVRPAGSGGHFVIGAGVPATRDDYGTAVAVRTGTGSIEVAAAGDFRLGNQASVLYTAGIDSQRGVPLVNDGGLEGRAYPTGGGDIEIRAGGNIVGAVSNQLITDWLWRTGSVGLSGLRSAATGWTVNHGRFQQNVAALGGGDVTIRAGGDVRDLSVSLPSIGRQDGGDTFARNLVTVTGGGDLAVRSGGSIVGGTYFVGRGAGMLSAGDSVGRVKGSAGVGATGAGPVFALQDGTMRVFARGDVGVESVVNPTLVPQGTSQNATITTVSYFSSYAPASGLDIVSAGGDVHLFNNADSRLNSRLTSINVGVFGFVFGLYPPQLAAAALSGDVTVHNDLVLYPSSEGDLRLLAGSNVHLDNGARAAQVVLADTDPAFLPTPVRPTTPSFLSTLFTVTSAGGFTNGFVAPSPTHAAGSVPARIVALSGDVSSTNAASVLFSAKPVRVSAGRDIRDLDLLAQNLGAGDITALLAGRDVAYTTGRAPDGRVLTSDNEIRVLGPGRLQVAAGRDLDLQTSRGLSTVGNALNAALAAEGASISVLAGVPLASLDYAAFIDKYLAKSTTYDAALLAYVSRYGTAGTSKAEALAAFDALEPDQQRGLIETLLFAEVREGGREAAKAGAANGDFTRAFTALETLFPGSNPDVDAGEENAYSGDIKLFFSRIYTLAGGDISLIAPGGEINVGLAAPPTAFGITKAASELGIVAQRTGSVTAVAFGDFQVNESRVFAADGGDILVWSTRGDIDAGRGAKTAISAPPPLVTIDPQTGLLRVEFPPALAGSGIQTLATSPGRKPGNVDLFAPRGVVNAGDAGIVAGNLTIAATAVLGADNISVSGVSVGVPVDTGGFAAALTGVSAVASSASSAAEDTVGASRAEQESDTPLADQALGFLDVFVTGFGDGSTSGQQEEQECNPATQDCPEE